MVEKFSAAWYKIFIKYGNILKSNLCFLKGNKLQEHCELHVRVIATGFVAS